MERSVGKFERSETMTRRFGSRSLATRSAADRILKRLLEMVSVTTTSSSAAPISGASLLPRRLGNANHPAVFHERIRPSLHSPPITAAAREAAALGGTPSELPSR